MILAIDLLQHLCFLLSHIPALTASSRQLLGSAGFPGGASSQGPGRPSEEAVISILSSHRARASARRGDPCKCLQGSSTTLPLMLNKVSKSKALCKCCSHYQVGVLWFASRRAQLLQAAGIRSRSGMFDIQLCREKTDIRAWHAAMKEDAI